MKNKPEHSANAVEIQNKKHLWKKGESGNPAGKKTGTRHRTTLAVERLLDGEGEELTRKAIELAKEYGSDSSPKFVNGVLGKVLMEETSGK